MTKIFQLFSLFCFCLMLLSTSSFAQKGYHIDVELDNYAEKEIVFAYQILNRYPVVDTISINKDGNYTIEADSALIPGVYLLVLPPNNDFITLLINKDEQHFSLKSNFEDLTGSMQITGSPDNARYYEYMNYLNDQVAGLSKYRQAAAETTDPQKQKEFQNQFNEEVKLIRKHQLKLIEDHPDSFTAALIKAEIEKDIPDFQGTPDDVQYQKYAFRKAHYFDYINMADERLVRSEALFDKIDYYLTRMTHSDVDSIKVSIDHVLGLLKPAPENFKYYLDHIMVTYASSDVIGMDGVFVHIVENYYAKGMAPWVDSKDLNEMIDDVTKRKKVLIGSIAPDIQMELRDGTPFSLHEVDADFTVLYLWQPNCSHCKKSLPFMKDFYQKYKEKGVEVFAGCTKITKKVPECWKYVDENEIGKWINTVDPFLRSKFVQLYLAEKTPKIYILDKEKRIVMKDITAEQLEEVMPMLMEKKMNVSPSSGRSKR